MYNNVNQETNVINTTNTVENFDKVQDQSYSTTSGPIKTVHTEDIRWDKVNKYLQEFGYPYNVGKGDFIPEQMVYLLAMKANNEKAKEFQAWLADEVLPQIRRTGKYDDTQRANHVVDTCPFTFKDIK